LTTITVTVHSLVPGGTASTIKCGSSEASTDANGDGTLTLTGVLPATYSCEIVVDP